MGDPKAYEQNQQPSLYAQLRTLEDKRSKIEDTQSIEYIAISAKIEQIRNLFMGENASEFEQLNRRHQAELESLQLKRDTNPDYVSSGYYGNDYQSIVKRQLKERLELFYRNDQLSET